MQQPFRAVSLPLLLLVVAVLLLPVVMLHRVDWLELWLVL